MELGLAGKTVIVTGGGSNIGRAIVFAFIHEGANVIIADKSLDDGQKAADKANSLGGGRAIAIATDVTKLDEVEAMVKKALDNFKKVDVLVNDVGWTKPMLFLKTTPELWNQEIAINYISVLNCCKVVLPYMKEQKGGAIINISSEASRIGQVGEEVYAGCKSAVNLFSISIAKDFGRYGIRINVVCPGLTPPSTPEEIAQGSIWDGVKPTEEQLEEMAMAIPLRKFGKATDIAKAVIFFASEVAAGHITGQILSVNGGFDISANMPRPKARA
jgi:2-hydroxycyclohexanecarboxyl-CoA dehydrogenase